MKKLFLAFVLPILALCACTNAEPNPEPDPDDIESYPENDKDLNPNLNDWEATITITFDGDDANITGQTEADATATISGANVNLALDTEKLVKIVVTGSSSNGSLRISGERKHLVELQNLTLTSTDRPAINDQNSKRMFLMVTGKNKLADGANYIATTEDRKGCLFAESHIILCGSGSLEIQGNYRHGLATDGFLYVNPGVTLKVSDAKKNAIHVKGSGSVNNAYRGIEIAGGTITALTSAANGKAMKCDGKIVISGGKVNLACTGDAAIDEEDGTLGSPACIKSNQSVYISGTAALNLDCSGTGAKGINADTDINISGGVISASLSGTAVEQNGDSSTPKGMIAHNELIVSDGTINIEAIGTGSVAIETDTNASFSGGATTAFGIEQGFASPRATATGGTILIGGTANSVIDGAKSKSCGAVIKGETTEIGSASFTWPVTLTSATIIYYGY